MAVQRGRIATLVLMFAVAVLSASDARQDAETTKGTDTRDARGSRPDLDVEVTPWVAVGPAQIEIEVHVAPHPDNRFVNISIDSGGYFRSTEIPLDGADAAARHWVMWRAVPAGEYVLTAIVGGSDGERDRLVLRQPQVRKP